jgi:iron complex outermembrane recepter protein
MSLRVMGQSFMIDVLLVAALAIAGTIPAFATESHQFDVPAEDAPTAISDFASQAHVQILVAGENVRDKHLHPVSGEFSTEQGLRLLLADSGLSPQYVGERSIALVKVSDANSAPQGNAKEGKKSSSGDFRVAQVDQGKSSGVSSIANQTSNSPENSNGSPGLSEIIVTAQKRNERLQDVPVPVTAINADTLVNSNQLRIEDYYSSVPGLSVSPGDEHGAPQLAIRGITTGGFTTPTVGIVVDDVPFGGAGINYGFEAPDIDPSDLARVEVLRGPQGTLYGDSSMGGLLKYVTIDPSTDELTGRLQAGTSAVRNGNQLGYNVRGSVNVPVTNDFALRASGFSRLDPGYIDNIVGGERAVNRGDAYGGRLSTLWKPAEGITLKLSALFQHDRVDGSPDITVGPGLKDLQQSDIPGTGWRQNEIQAYSANLNAKFAGVDLTSITGYSINTITDSYDFQSPLYTSIALAPPFNVSGTPLPEDVKTSQFTQEIRLSGAIGAKIDWLLGAFYDHVNSKLIETVLAADPTTGQVVGNLGSFLSTDPPSLFSEYALFTDWTWKITDQFDLQVGGRESENRTSPPPTVVTGVLGTTFCGSLPCVFPAGGATTDHSFTYLVTPRFKISPDLMVYARLASGYRPGGSNSQPTPLPVYKPDSTDNYEIGVKGNAFQHMLSFDASVYYIKWQDIQIQLRDPLTNNVYLGNGAGAKSQGVELAAETRPLAGLTISGWTAWDDAVLTQATAYGAAGDRLPNSSRFSANLAIRQEFPLTAAVVGFVSGSESYVGDRQGVFVSPPPRQGYPAYAKTDLQAGAKYQSWTLNLFANNVTDRRGVLSGGIGSLNANNFYLIQPRTVGLSVSKTF